MAATVAKMTPEELKEMIGTIIEQKLLELIGDPDEGLLIRKSLYNRLMRQKRPLHGANVVNYLPMSQSKLVWCKHHVYCPHFKAGNPRVRETG